MINNQSKACEDLAVDVSASDVFYVGEHRVETQTGEVSSRAGTTRLEPRAMEVLVYLASRSGRVVSKETMKEEVWGRQHVVDAAVKRCISQVRKAFGDDPAQPRTIQTLPKRGYRLIAPVSLRGGHRKQRARTPFLAAAAAIATLAFGVSSTTTLSGGPAADSLHRLDLYEIARTQYHRYDEAGANAAIAIYEALLRDNPRDSVALAGLADTLMQQYLRGSRDEGLAGRARRAALESIRLDDTRPDAFKALGAFYHFHGDHERAMTFYEQAVHRDASYWTALNNGAEILRDQGQYRAARGWFQCALASTPRKIDVLVRLAGVESRADNVAAAEGYLNIAALLDPSNEEIEEARGALRERHNRAVAAKSDTKRYAVTEFPCDRSILDGYAGVKT